MALILVLTTSCTPRWLVNRVAESYPGCVYDFAPREKLVALTIDDGPDAVTTPKLLGLLEEYDARATFFLISDRVTGNDSLVAELVRQRHEIGNHFSRNQASIRLSPAAFERSFLHADSVLREFGPVVWVRPGSGFFNARMLAVFRAHEYRCALGSVYPFDPQLPFARYGAGVVLREVYPGAVIVLHDGGYKGRNTVNVLERVLPELARRGYRVVTLSTLVAADTVSLRGSGRFTRP
ncbi:MAG: polysaccharide deacetylase family protein [Gemmatimonadota bacterium]|nr:polysaccharide deacetylase family protein [Gemmatimonadota bacterium]